MCSTCPVDMRGRMSRASSGLYTTLLSSMYASNDVLSRPVGSSKPTAIRHGRKQPWTGEARKRGGLSLVWPGSRCPAVHRCILGGFEDKICHQTRRGARGGEDVVRTVPYRVETRRRVQASHLSSGNLTSRQKSRCGDDSEDAMAARLLFVVECFPQVLLSVPLWEPMAGRGFRAPRLASCRPGCDAKTPGPRWGKRRTGRLDLPSSL